jgi:integrase
MRPTNTRWQPPEGLAPEEIGATSTDTRVRETSIARGLVLPNLKNWTRDNRLANHEPLFFSRQRAADGGRKAIDRVRAWKSVTSSSARANVRVLAMRATGQGSVGEPAPVHPHLFRHARVRQTVRHTKSLALAQKQAGWARLHTEYLSLSDDEAQRLIRGVPE